MQKFVNQTVHTINQLLRGLRVRAVAPDGSWKDYNTMLDAATELGMNAGSIKALCRSSKQKIEFSLSSLALRSSISSTAFLISLPENPSVNSLGLLLHLFIPFIYIFIKKNNKKNKKALWKC